jgi:hypothetical protein
MIDTPKPNQDEPTTSAQPIETVLPTMKERAPTGFGLVTQMHVGVMGMMGMMGQMQLADIREKTRRGQEPGLPPLWLRRHRAPGWRQRCRRPEDQPGRGQDRRADLPRFRDRHGAAADRRGAKC